MSDLLSYPGSIVPERAIWTDCPMCRRTQWLHEVPVTEDAVRVTYLCAEGCGPILTLTFGSSYGSPALHMRDLMIENPCALFCRPISGDQESIRFPPSV